MAIVPPHTHPRHEHAQYADAGFAVPTGAVIAYGGSTAPTGWHLCNGTAHGSPELLAVLGSATTPDLRDKFILGDGGSQPNTGGEATVTLSAAQSGVAEHTHVLPMGGTPGVGTTADTPARNVTAADPGFRTAGVAASASYGSSSGPMGASAPHNNMPPYYALTYIIKT